MHAAKDGKALLRSLPAIRVTQAVNDATLVVVLALLVVLQHEFLDFVKAGKGTTEDVVSDMDDVGVLHFAGSLHVILNP